MNIKLQVTSYKLQVGQSLLEVTVLVGLALITVSGLVIVTVNGLKNSQFSQNQAQATKIAQEGMDQIKSISSRNCAVNFGGSFFWFNSLSNGVDLVWNQDWSAAPKFKITNYSACNDTTAGLSQGTPDLDPATSGGIFTREITIQDDIDLVTSSANCSPSTSCKRVTVRVFWNDYSGSHESKLVTILTEN